MKLLLPGALPFDRPAALAVLCLLGWLGLVTTSFADSVVEYGARVQKKMPHSRSDFTQGLEIRDGLLYQSTGRYGESRLQVFDLASGKLLQEKRLSPYYFAEGMTVLDERILQLTWKEGTALAWRRSDLAPLAQFPIKGEGWGLTNDGKQLIYSDGSDKLYFISPNDWTVTRTLRVTMKGRPQSYLNELEWTPDYLLANVWGSNRILMIDLETGQVSGRIDLRGLLPQDEIDASTDVLNGIALDPDSGDLWVTGKNWPWLYQIELFEKNLR